MSAQSELGEAPDVPTLLARSSAVLSAPHRLLARQLARLGVDPFVPPGPAAFAQLLVSVDRTYRDHDRQRYLVDRATLLASEEMRELHAEQAATSHFLATVLDSLAHGVCVCDRAGTVRLANPEAARILARSPGTLVDAPIADLLRNVKRRDGGEVLGPLRVGIDEGVGVEIDDAVVAPEGGGPDEVRFVRIALTPAELRGASAVLVIVDETESVTSELERERLEERLRKGRELEAIGGLAAGVAHDFNNLLGAIMSCAELLADEVTGESADDVAEIQRAARRGAALTRQLVQFSRQDRIDLGPVDLNACVEETVGILARTFDPSVTVTCRLAQPPVTAVADPVGVEQVITNLVVNARDAVSPGGSIVLTTRLEPCDDSGRCRAVLSVADDGSGMSPDVAARACEPFFTTKATGSGTGLGLATSYGIVSSAGGDLVIDSELGRGTTITVLLPSADCDEDD